MPFCKDKTEFNYTIICSDPDDSIIKMLDETTEPILQKTGYSLISSMITVKEGALWLNDNVLGNTIMKKLIGDDKTKFDIIIVCPFLASEAGYYLAHKWNSAIGIYYSGQSQIPFINSALGQPFNPSYVSMPVLPFTGDMNFVQRAINTMASFMFEHVLRNIIILKGVNDLLDKHFPGETRPNLLDLEKNVSVAFSFGHPLILDGMSPLVPNYIPLGKFN